MFEIVLVLGILGFSVIFSYILAILDNPSAVYRHKTPRKHRTRLQEARDKYDEAWMAWREGVEPDLDLQHIADKLRKQLGHENAKDEFDLHVRQRRDYKDGDERWELKA